MTKADEVNEVVFPKTREQLRAAERMETATRVNARRVRNHVNQGPRTGARKRRAKV